MPSVSPLSLLLVILGTIAASSPGEAEEAGSLPPPVFHGALILPKNLEVEGTPFGGISGLDYDAANDTFYALSDDRAQRGPARYYTLHLTLDADGIHGIDITSMHVLRPPGGGQFSAGEIDPEALRLSAAGTHFYWSSEGDENSTPEIFISDLDGRASGQLSLPDAYLPNPTGTHHDGTRPEGNRPNGTQGVRDNLGFEAITLSPDNTRLYAITENALIQDGSQATLYAGSPSRIIVFDLASGNVAAEYVYESDPIFRAPAFPLGGADNGVSEALALADGRLLVIERSYAAGVGNHIALYVVDLDDADDISGLESIADRDVRAVRKTPWLVLDEGTFGLDLDNIEAASFGPMIDGQPSLVLASDDNFNPLGQVTQFLLFTFTAPNAIPDTEPSGGLPVSQRKSGTAD
ncbi:esterase-like activity of phytase family protein [Afifella sp. H1R]|uniref:esterase-like activity of phytase family protein n=1 Tax=Afifella sp. H1R TaxID=2908841 RepID=UPI001F1B9137|nr:esterase-like activity of phytase family protein [Afifella sp. H1R]